MCGEPLLNIFVLALSSRTCLVGLSVLVLVYLVGEMTLGVLCDL